MMYRHRVDIETDWKVNPPEIIIKTRCRTCDHIHYPNKHCMSDCTCTAPTSFTMRASFDGWKKTKQYYTILEERK